MLWRMQCGRIRGGQYLGWFVDVSPRQEQVSVWKGSCVRQVREEGRTDGEIKDRCKFLFRVDQGMMDVRQVWARM